MISCEDPSGFARELARRGLSARKLARAAGLDESVLSQWRRGHRRLRAENFRKLAATLQAYPVVPGADLIIPREERVTGEAVE